MKKKTFKVGDIIKATDNNYTVSCKNNRWIGIITEINDKKIKAKTLYCKYFESCIGDEFKNLKPSEFEVIYQNLEKDDNTLYPLAVMLDNIFG